MPLAIIIFWMFSILPSLLEGGREGGMEGGREGGWVGGRRIVIIMPEALYCVEGRRQKQS
jgi:hypothetical protein